LGAQEPEAVGMSDHASLDEAGLVGKEQRAAAVPEDFALALHRGDPPLDALALRAALDAEALDQVILGDRHTGPGERAKHVLAARDLGGIALQALGFARQSSARRVKFRVSAPRWRNW